MLLEEAAQVCNTAVGVACQLNQPGETCVTLWLAWLAAEQRRCNEAACAKLTDGHLFC